MGFQPENIGQSEGLLSPGVAEPLCAYEKGRPGGRPFEGKLQGTFREETAPAAKLAYFFFAVFLNSLVNSPKLSLTRLDSRSAASPFDLLASSDSSRRLAREAS